MKTLINITLLSIAMIFVSTLNAQDTIKKKNGEVLKVVVKKSTTVKSNTITLTILTKYFLL